MLTDENNLQLSLVTSDGQSHGLLLNLVRPNHKPLEVVFDENRYGCGLVVQEEGVCPL